MLLVIHTLFACVNSTATGSSCIGSQSEIHVAAVWRRNNEDTIQMQALITLVYNQSLISGGCA